MAVVADFVVIGSAAAAENGKWKSRPFEAGGRKRLEVNNNEIDNAFVSLVLTSPEGGQNLRIRVIVNDNPLPVLMLVPREDQRTIVVAFPASLLHEHNNILELASVDQRAFIVLHAICHFRQDS